MSTVTFSKILGSAILSFTLIGIAAAQNPPVKPSSPNTPANSAASAGTATLGISAAETQVVASGWRARVMLRTQVYNDNNQKIGKVEDLIVAPDGSSATAIINVAGFVGLGTRRVAIPVKQFKQITPKIILPGSTKEALKALPEFKYPPFKEALPVPALLPGAVN